MRQDGKPVSGITLELRSELKTLVTGDDDTFRFENVESGHHSLTALRGGEVVGYAEFTLCGGSVNLDYTVAEDGTVNISVPDNTAAVNLDLDLTEDGVLQVTDVQAIKGTNPGGDSPQTGDSGMILLWLTLLVLSCGVLTTLVVTRKRKKITK